MHQGLCTDNKRRFHGNISKSWQFSLEFLKRYKNFDSQCWQIIETMWNSLQDTSTEVTTDVTL